MRLLVVTPELLGRSAPPGARLAHSLARMAQREGHRVQALAMRADPFVALAADAETRTGLRSGLVDGLPVWLVAPAAGLDGGLAAMPDRVGQRFDLVHAVSSAAQWPLIAAVAAGGLPLVVTLVGLPGPDCSALADLRRALQRELVRIVVPSQHAAACWQPLLPECPVRVLSHGVSLLALPGAGTLATPASGEATLLCAGAFEGRSGVGELLQSFARVGRPGLRLRLLCESDADRSAASSLRQAAAADPRVSIEPCQGPASLETVRGPCDLVCLPALEAQAFSMLALECAAIGLDCMASDLGAQAEAVRRYRCGSVVPAGDVGAWARAIQDWAADFLCSRGDAAHAAVPMRIEEEAFLYEGVYRELLFATGRTGVCR